MYNEVETWLQKHALHLCHRLCVCVQGSSDFCFAPDTYVTKVGRQYGVINQGMTPLT